MATNSTKVWTPNPLQTKVIDFLKANPGQAFTLVEISEKIGETVKSGSVNTLATHQLVQCNKDARVNVCPCCGHKTKVSTWEIVSD